MALEARALEELDNITSRQTDLVILESLKVVTISSDSIALILDIKFF